MEVSLLAGTQSNGARVMPNVGSIAAELTQPNIVSMRRVTVLEHQHQFVRATIERAHASGVFRPYTHVFVLGIGGSPALSIWSRWRQSEQTKWIEPGVLYANQKHEYFR